MRPRARQKSGRPRPGRGRACCAGRRCAVTDTAPPLLKSPACLRHPGSRRNRYSAAFSEISCETLTPWIKALAPRPLFKLFWFAPGSRPQGKTHTDTDTDTHTHTHAHTHTLTSRAWPANGHSHAGQRLGAKRLCTGTHLTRLYKGLVVKRVQLS